MSWWSDITRALMGLTPRQASEVVTTSFVPNLAAAKEMTANAVADTYGDLVELLTDGGNASDCWVEALVLHTPDKKTEHYSVCLSREAAGSAPTAIEAQVPAFIETTVLADHQDIVPINPPCYFPKGTGIRAACSAETGAQKISVWAIISRGR